MSRSVRILWKREPDCESQSSSLQTRHIMQKTAEKQNLFFVHVYLSDLNVAFLMYWANYQWVHLKDNSWFTFLCSFIMSVSLKWCSGFLCYRSFWMSIKSSSEHCCCHLWTLVQWAKLWRASVWRIKTQGFVRLPGSLVRMEEGLQTGLLVIINDWPSSAPLETSPVDAKKRDI